MLRSYGSRTPNLQSSVNDRSFSLCWWRQPIRKTQHAPDSFFPGSHKNTFSPSSPQLKFHNYIVAGSREECCLYPMKGFAAGEAGLKTEPRGCLTGWLSVSLPAWWLPWVASCFGLSHSSERLARPLGRLATCSLALLADWLADWLVDWLAGRVPAWQAAGPSCVPSQAPGTPTDLNWVKFVHRR